MSRGFSGLFLRQTSVGMVAFLAVCVSVVAQSAGTQKAATSPEPVRTLEHDFFSALRGGQADKILAYVPQQGLEVGPNARPATRDQVEQQFRSRRGLYCKLFDSACIDDPIKLDNAARTCSYRELLTHSDKVRTAASQVTRNGVQQAVLVAQIQNSQCPDTKLIDFIFNLQPDGWKLFSIP